MGYYVRPPDPTVVAEQEREERAREAGRARTPPSREGNRSG